MTVYALFRRGNYLIALLSGLVGSSERLYRLAKLLGKESWMESALYFTSPCTRTGCILCQTKGRQVLSRRTHHVLTVRIDMQLGVRAMVDEEFEKPEAWLFVELPEVKELEARAFFDYISKHVTGYNVAGYTYNFLPFGCTIGVQADNNWRGASRFFCSEMLTAFLQTHHYPMGLVPCKTTPQQLLVSLLRTFPGLVHKQRMLNPASSQYELISVKDNAESV